VKVSLHQGSVLSPLQFSIVLEAVSQEFREGLPWELLFADDLALLAQTKKNSCWRWLGVGKVGWKRRAAGEPE